MQVRERESQTVLVRLSSSKLSPWGDFGLVFLSMKPESKGEFMKTQIERHLLILISQLSLRGAMPRGYCCFRSILCWSHYWMPYPNTKCSCRVMNKISDKSHQGALTIILYFWVIFAGIALKLEKGTPTFSSSNPYPSVSFVASEDRKDFLCLNIVSNNKTGALVLEFNWCEKRISFFKNSK